MKILGNPYSRSETQTGTAHRGTLAQSHFCSIKITEDVRKYAAEQAISEEEALAKGMEEKSKEFVESGAEVYTTA
jgi:phosphomethylpyrimidine synthase